MKQIWKYDLIEVGTQAIIMPFGAEILTVQNQFNEPKIWVLVDVGASNAIRVIRIVGTGHSIENDISDKYIGTYQTDGGNYIYHVFDLGYK